MIGERIKRLRSVVEFSGEVLAKSVGVTQPFISAIERGEREPSREVLISLAKALNTSVAYLIGETDDPAPPREAWSVGPSPEAAPRSETNVSGYIPIGEMYPVPYYDIKSCAGNGVAAFLEDVELIRTIPLPLEWIGAISTDDNQKPFLTRIDGNSMEASGLPDGMLALVNPAEEVYSGQAALVCFGENRERAIKHVYYLPNGGIELRSASSEYPVITYSRKQHRPMDEWEDGSDSLDIIGRVMGAWGEPKRR